MSYLFSGQNNALGKYGKIDKHKITGFSSTSVSVQENTTRCKFLSNLHMIEIVKGLKNKRDRLAEVCFVSALFLDFLSPRNILIHQSFRTWYKDKIYTTSLMVV